MLFSHYQYTLIFETSNTVLCYMVFGDRQCRNIAQEKLYVTLQKQLLKCACGLGQFWLPFLKVLSSKQSGALTDEKETPHF